MRIVKILFCFIILSQVVFANHKLNILASNIATPFYNVYNKNVLEFLEQHISKNKNIEAIKIYDTTMDQTTIVYYKKDDKFIYKIDKDFPARLKLPNRQDSTKIIKDGKTIGILTVYYNTTINGKLLSKKESEYLNHKEIIRMCVDPNWLPFEKIEDGKHIGLAADLIKIMSANINIPIKLIPTKNWQESIDFAKNRKCDILSLASKTPSREKFMNFTSAYLDISIVIATKTSVPFIDDIKQIKNKKLAVTKGYSIQEKLKNTYPDINLIEVDSIDEGLKKLKNGDVFGYLDNSITLNYEIQKNYVGVLAISGKFEERFDLSVATRNDEPLLLDIFEKAINSIKEKTKNELYKKWVSIKIEKIKITDYSLAYKVISLSIFILLIFGYWNRKITKANRELEIAKKEIEKLAITDKLTGLYNRVKLDEMLEHEIIRCKRYNHPMAFCILDIDYFKSVNDIYGHQVGDQVLIEFAQLLQNNTRMTDYIGRWGGEEFLIICPMTNKSGVLKLIENLRLIIESHNFLGVGSITASFGVTLFQKDSDTIESIIKRADEALYKAKKSGRNKAIFLEDTL